MHSEGLVPFVWLFVQRTKKDPTPNRVIHSTGFVTLSRIYYCDSSQLSNTGVSRHDARTITNDPSQSHRSQDSDRHLLACAYNLHYKVREPLQVHLRFLGVQIQYPHINLTLVYTNVSIGMRASGSALRPDMVIV